MYIYKITNIINGKCYIGQSIHPIQKRFHRHINDSINNIIDTHFARAIRKYGESNFLLEQIDTATNQKELTEKEQYWIKYYKSNNPSYGYNETDAIYKSGGNTYQNKTKEEIDKISQKIRESKIGTLNSNSRKIKCYNIETKEELFFDTVKECQKYFNEKTHRFITSRVQYITRSLYNGKWAIAYAENEYPKFFKKVSKRGISIEIFDMVKNITQSFVSIRQASRSMNIPRNLIQNAIKNPSNYPKIYNRYIISVHN